MVRHVRARRDATLVPVGRRVGKPGVGQDAIHGLLIDAARSGKRADTLQLLNELTQESARDYVQPYTFALIYIGLGNKEQALNWLEKQMSGHSETANQYAVDPELDDLRSEPRFKEMLKRMKLPE